MAETAYTMDPLVRLLRGIDSLELRTESVNDPLLKTPSYVRNFFGYNKLKQELQEQKPTAKKGLIKFIDGKLTQGEHPNTIIHDIAHDNVAIADDFNPFFESIRALVYDYWDKRWVHAFDATPAIAKHQGLIDTYSPLLDVASYYRNVSIRGRWARSIRHFLEDDEGKLSTVKTVGAGLAPIVVGGAASLIFKNEVSMTYVALGFLGSVGAIITLSPILPDTRTSGSTSDAKSNIFLDLAYLQTEIKNAYAK